MDTLQYEDAEYQGRQVTLNKPFRTPDGSKKFAVYVRNDKGNVVVVRFGDPESEIRRDDKEARANFRARHNCSEQNDKTTAAYWSCRMWEAGSTVSEMLDSKGYKASFTDKVNYDPELKRAVSVRDGVLVYLGAELGLEPADKEFTVYRSPATIARAAALMDGIPLTNDHVDPSLPVETPIGKVLASDVIDFFSDETDSRLGIANELQLDDGASVALAEGKRELSLGYGGTLYESDKYDFEQRDIEPHHLAVVLAGRCGPSCAFLDVKPPLTEEKTMANKSNGQDANKPAKSGQGALLAVFLDAEGQPNLEQIAEIATRLPEALRKLPMDRLSEVMPALQEIVAAAGDANGMSEEMEDNDGTKIEAGDEGDGQEREAMDMKMEDSAKFKDAVAAASKAAVKDHAEVSAKAVSLMGKDYQFADKSVEAIMRECVAVQHPGTHFADSELRIAFKMLKPAGTDVSNFGDGDPSANRFSQLADKDV